MASSYLIARHYCSLTGAERFRLMIEAGAREDRVEEGRLDGSCPLVQVRAEDPAYRQRMRLSFTLASMTAMQIRPRLAQLLAVGSLIDVCRQFGEHLPSARMAAACFLYGRSYGKCEVGAVEDAAQTGKELLANVTEDLDLQQQLAEVRECATEGLVAALEEVVLPGCRVYATEILSVWEGFCRFCREEAELEPLTLMRAWGLMDADPAELVRELDPEALPEPGRADEWADAMTRNWRRRFAAEPGCT